MYKQILIIIISSSLLGCATGGGEPTEERSEARVGGSDCISQGSIRDYTVLDDANLIVTERPKRKYHVVLSRRAVGLRSSWRIAFSSHTGRICGGFGELVVDEGFGPAKIRIASIRRLSPEDEEDLLIRFGKKEPQQEQPRAPEETEGAEVEELD